MNRYSYSAIYILSILVTPTDGKADNYIVQIDRKENGSLKTLKIVGIDNDKAFEFSVKTNKAGGIYPGLKSVILCLPNANLPIGISMINYYEKNAFIFSRFIH